MMMMMMNDSSIRHSVYLENSCISEAKINKLCGDVLAAFIMFAIKGSIGQTHLQFFKPLKNKNVPKQRNAGQHHITTSKIK